jgi:hypothetical protein
MLLSPRAGTFSAPLHKASSQSLSVFFTCDPTSPNTHLYILSHSTMADNKKQPVSFDDIIKAGKQKRAPTCAGLTTNHCSRPPKAQE